MMRETLPPTQNILLGAISESELDLVLRGSKIVALGDKQLICAQEESIEAVYFPLSGAISLLMKTSEGNAVEGAVVGSQGFFGIPLLLEAEDSFAEAIIQVSGQAVRIPAAVFKEKLRAAPQLMKVLLRYAQFFYKESFISIGCNRFHSSEQRIARWLLEHRERTGRDVFPFTHEFMAFMLGAQRSTVSEATGELQRKDVIRCNYGEITVTDRAGLEKVSCECYGKVRQALYAFLAFVDKVREGPSPVRHAGKN
jgi:CRP-like cAMP-binding protein